MSLTLFRTSRDKGSSAPDKPAAGAPAAGAPVTHQITLGSQQVSYTLRRSQRRSIGFLISSAGLQVTAPKHASHSHIEQALLSKQRWIISKLQEQAQEPVAQTMLWQHGAQFPLLGQMVTLMLAPDAPRLGRYDPLKQELHLRQSAEAEPAQVQLQVQRFLQKQAMALFVQRLPLFARELGLQYASFSLSSARGRWGSCNSQKKIRLNWRLVHFDLPLIDYVIVHELAHLQEMNHSPRFWAIVAQIYPNYQAVRLAIRQHATRWRQLF
jgi:predicted metal-dependent hydrolase